MAKGFNRVVIMGNLARDPEIRYTVDKRAWARFTVAVGSTWKNKNGELQNEVDFIPVVVWGPRADTCGRYLKKGSAVLVEGRIKVRSYEAKDGSGKRYATDVEASDVLFVGSRRDSDSEDFSGAPDRDASRFPSGEPKGPPSSFGDDADFGASLREKGKGFGNTDFPMDVSELGDGEDGGPEAEIPF